MVTQIQEFVDKGAAADAMHPTVAAGASLREPVDWHSVNWKLAHRNVRRLQARIVKALKAGKERKVRALQFILARSLSGRAIAVKRATTNRGKKTPGVDGEIWDTPRKKAQAVEQLRSRGYHSQPLRRKAIPKKNGGQRFLGIPTMKDRAIQALYALTLDPIAETLADPNSYGFRRERSPADAIEQCFGVLARRTSAQWVLEGDIKACFDHISHEWLLDHIPLPKSTLRKWLKAGYMKQDRWYPTDSGTPQGGTISPVLANMALDGLEQELRRQFGPTHRLRNRHQVNLIRFADDFVTTGRTKELLEDKVQPVVESFLAERGLLLSATKTHITHISEGFDFLGQNLRKHGPKLLIRPSNGSVKAILGKVRAVIKANPQANAGHLVIQLNPIIRGWANYHRHIVSKKTFNKVDWLIYGMMWRWAQRKHRKKSVAWRNQKYFKPHGNRRRVFTGEVRNSDGTTKQVHLYQAAKTPIVRHRKIKGAANPYDQEWEVYFEERLNRRMIDNPKGYRRLLQLWLEQDGKCLVCGQKLAEERDWNVHHLCKRVEGGEDTLDNLVLLHSNCHRQVHCQGWRVSKPRPVKRALAEA
jgi:RNA-directed DNA polymerase